MFLFSSKARTRAFMIGATLLAVLAFIVNEPELKILSSEPDIQAVGDRPGSLNKKETSSDTILVEQFDPTLPSSLKGTSHGVVLTIHQDGLVITSSLKDLFDYYLSASGEESFSQIDSRIKEDLSSQLTALALTQALEIWQNYVTYKTELVEFDQQYPANSNQLDKLQHLKFLQQRQLSLIALQDQIFSESVAQILFSFDRQLDNHTLEKARVMASDLSADAKQQSLVNLNAQLPIEVAISLERNKKQQRLLEINADDELTSEDKFNLRAKQVGEAAASRLQKLDDQRNAWKQRIAEFKLQKQQLISSELANEDYEIALEKLYQQHFLPKEQLRAKALTR